METLFDALAETARTHPDHAFLVVPAAKDRPYLQEGAEYTFRDVHARAAALADLYQAAGWGPGHRVALALDNHPDHFIHFLALNRIGVSQVPVNPFYLQDELQYLFDHSEAALIVAAPWRAAQVSGFGPPVAAADAGFAPPAAPSPAAGPTGRGAEMALIYTSGTTARPKGCVLDNDYAFGVGEWYRDLGGALTLEKGRERIFVPLPVFHVNGGINTPAAMILSANAMIMPDRFHGQTWWEDIRATRATAMHYLGVIPPVLLAAPESAEDKTHGLKFGLGAGLDPALHQAFEDRFALPMVEVWGMTETGRFLANAYGDRMPHTRAFGRATEEMEAMVAGPNGAPAKEGELLVRTPGPSPRKFFFREYLKNPEATEEAWRGGWFHTGDIVRRDETGMLHFVERAKNIIRRSGENISAAEVENALIAHPEVTQVAVLSCPDEMRDEEVFACVTGGVEPEALLRFAAERIARYKIPGWVAMMKTLPVTGTQKIKKHEIFGKGVDPRADPRAQDLRAFKKTIKP